MLSSLMAKDMSQINALGTRRARESADLRLPREAGGTRFPLGGHREVIQAKKEKKIKDADKTEKPTEKSPGDASENPNSTLMELTSSNQKQD